MLEFRTLHERRLVLVHAEGEVRGPAYLSAMMSLLEADPRLLRYDFLYDLKHYEGGVTHDDLAELARRLTARFGPIDARGAVTVVATPDIGYRHWLPLINLQFPHRRFAWAPTLALAEAELAAAAVARGALSLED